MATQFKAGDKVRCVDSSDGFVGPPPAEGTVDAADEATVRLVGSDIYWKASRFALVTEAESGQATGYSAPTESVERGPERTGPHDGVSDLGHEQVIAALTEALPANQAARKRMVAALSAEMSQPVSTRKVALERKFGARDGIDTTGGFSGSGWED